MSTLTRFLIAGGLAYLVNQAVLFVLYDGLFVSLPRTSPIPLVPLNTALLLASLIAVEASIVVRFVVNDRWTFRNRCRKWLPRRFLESNLTSLASPIISVTAVNILTPVFGVNYLIANSIGILLGLAWNWGWSNWVIWAYDLGHPLKQH